MNRGKWLELVACAIAGTAKRAPAVILPNSDAEDSLLSQAAVYSVSLKSGFVAAELGAAVHAPEELRPTVSAGTKHLRRCFDLSPALVEEWLRFAAECRVLVPHELLVEALEFGASDRRRGGLVRGAIGERGVWLAKLNPEWSYALSAPDDHEAWLDGKAADRLEALARIRTYDPAQARELLQEAMKQEAADFRTAGVAILRDRVSTEDEPFLMSLLTDRSTNVREEAANALALIEGGELRREAIAIATGLVRVQKSLLKRSVEFELPPIQSAPKTASNWLETFATIWPKPSAGAGWRETLLGMIIKLVPPQEWERFGFSPNDFVMLAKKGIHGNRVMIGLDGAVHLHRNSRWAHALLDNGGLAYGALEPAEIEAWLVGMRPEKLKIHAHHAMSLDSWSPHLTRAMMTELTGQYGYLDAIDAGLRMHPSLHGEALSKIDELNEKRIGIWREVLPLIREMKETIRKAATP